LESALDFAFLMTYEFWLFAGVFVLSINDIVSFPLAAFAGLDYQLHAAM
jgi:hypothetical protein